MCAHMNVHTLCVHIMSCMSSRVLPKHNSIHDGQAWLGRVCGHIKAFEFLPFPHQRKIYTEGLLGRYALCMLGRTLDLYTCMRKVSGHHSHELYLV